MPTTNKQILDRMIGHQVGLLRLSNGITRKLIALMNRVEDDLIRQIKAVEDPARLGAVLADVRRILHASRPETQALLFNELTDLAQYEAQYTKTLIEGAVPVKFSMTMPSENMLESIVKSTPFQGKLLKEWVEDLTESQRRGIRDAVRMGMVEGESIDAISRRIRGTRALQYKDGIMEISRRGAQAMVRTAVNHTATQSREALYKNNDDIVKGVQWVSTLDGRTTPICQSRDGQVFPVESGPRPPAHINCRSTTVPVVKSWRELGIDIDEAPASTRASMDGQVPDKTTYNEWLSGQPASVQDEILGKGKGELFRSGGFTVQDFVDDKGRAYTLAQLQGMDRLPVIPVVPAVPEAPVFTSSFVGLSEKKAILAEAVKFRGTTRGNYLYSSIEKASKSKKTLIIRDKNGSIISAANFYPEKDALRIDTLGSVGRGGGKEAIREAAKYSKSMGKGGAVELSPIGDANTIGFYINAGFDAHPKKIGNFLLTPEMAKAMGYIQ